MPFDDADPEFYEDGWSAPMDGTVFLANIEWRDARPGAALERDRPLRWGPVTDGVRELLGADAACFDVLDRSLAARFFRGECWVHSWRPAPSGAQSGTQSGSPSGSPSAG